MSRPSDSNPVTPPVGNPAGARDSLPVKPPAPQSVRKASTHSGSQGKAKPRPTRQLPTPTPSHTLSEKQLSCESAPTAKNQEEAKLQRKRLSRDTFNALLKATRQVDSESLAALQLDSEDEIAIDEQGDSLAQKVARHRSPISSFLISMTVHLIIFLTLTWFLVPERFDNVIEVVAELSVVADPVDRDTSDTDPDKTVLIPLPDDNQSPLDSTEDSTSTEDEVLTANTSLPVPSPVTPDPTPTKDVNPKNEVGDLPAMPTGGGLEGRDLDSRGREAAARGGSRASEAAVERGLAWIINHQRPDGSWRLNHNTDQCRGQCPDEGSIESSTAATGLALMALLGAGYTHQHGHYQNEVKAGLEFLVESMRQTRRGASLVRGPWGMYSQAIATIALAEAYAMTKDTWLVVPVAEARLYIEKAQHRRGGWRYNAGNAGDMAVTGWQLMALKSCKLGGADSPKEVWDNAESFIDSLRNSNGQFGYLRAGNPRISTTAIGGLMKMYLGSARNGGDVQLAAEHVAGEGPSKTDIYYNYYGTMLMFHRGGKEWTKWNGQMRDYLISTQDQSTTHRMGSWHFTDRHGNVGGRLYTTAMATMTLEVYYRYMPLYRFDDETLTEPAE